MDYLNLQQKFIALATLILALVILLGGVTVLQLEHLSGNVISRAEHAQSFDDSAHKLLEAKAKFKIQTQHWKNILLRGNEQSEFDNEKAQFDQHAEQVQQLLNEAKSQLQAHTESPDLDITHLQQEHENLTAKYYAALKQFNKDDPSSVKTIDAQVRGIDQEFTIAIEQKAHSVSERSAAQIRLDFDDTRMDIAQANQRYIITALIGLLSLMTLLWFFFRNIMQQIGGDPEQARQLAQQIVAGDLSTQIDTASPQSILGQLQQMSDWLANTILDLRHTSRGLTLLSQQVQHNSANVQQATEQQTKAIEQNSTTLVQISATVAQNAAHALRLERLIKESPEMHDLIQEIIYASKEQTQSIQLATKNLQLVAMSGDKNTATAQKLSEAAMRLSVEAENINAVFESFKID